MPRLLTPLNFGVEPNDLRKAADALEAGSVFTLPAVQNYVRRSITLRLPPKSRKAESK